MFGAIRTLSADGSGKYHIGFLSISLNSPYNVGMYLISGSNKFTCFDLKAVSATSSTMIYKDTSASNKNVYLLELSTNSGVTITQI